MRRKAALFGIVFCALIMRHLPVFAQQARSLTAPAYKNGVLQRIAGLEEQMLFALLMKNVEFLSESFTACELLASVYASRGNKELALRYFQKVLELAPGNRNAAKTIKELGGLPACPARTSRASLGEKVDPVAILVLLGEWFGDAYFPLKEEIDVRGWTMKRVGAPVRNRPATQPG